MSNLTYLTESLRALNEASDEVYIWNGEEEVPKDVERVEIENGVKVIKREAFAYCDSLKSIVLPNGIKNIDNFAFYGCHSLKSIILPNSVERIGDRAFAWCDSLISITISNNVEYICPGAFDKCFSLKTIKVGNPNLVPRLKREYSNIEILTEACKTLREASVGDKLKNAVNGNTKLALQIVTNIAACKNRIHKVAQILEDDDNFTKDHAGYDYSTRSDGVSEKRVKDSSQRLINAAYKLANIASNAESKILDLISDAGFDYLSFEDPKRMKAVLKDKIDKVAKSLPQLKNLSKEVRNVFSEASSQIQTSQDLANSKVGKEVIMILQGKKQ